MSNSNKTQQINEEMRRNPENECAICLSDFDNLSTTDVCKHRFCFECIKCWSETNDTCPLCKRQFSEIFHDFKEDGTHSSFEIGEYITLNVNSIADLVSYMTGQMFPYATIVSTTEADDIEVEDVADYLTEDGVGDDDEGCDDEPRYRAVLTVRIRDAVDQS